MKIKYLFLAVGVFLFAACNKGGSTIIEEVNKPITLAYLPTWKMPYVPQWEKITHLCIAFGIVESNGNLNMTEVNKFRSTINAAQSNNVKVLLSIGGGGTTNFTSALTDIKNRNTLVENIVKVINDYGFDGVDIDYEEWEGGPNGFGPSDIAKTDALEKLYISLREKFGNKKLITAAVTASWDNGAWGYYNCFNNSMHQYLDFVSLMIYDETGPWESSKVGQHASWEFFENSINFWLNVRKIPKEKLVAGVPFYGYFFKSENSAKDASSMPYKDILVNFPDMDAQNLDNIGLLYYNGISTIKKKAEFVKSNQLRGIMIWEITHDTKDEKNSLLNTIYKVF